MIQKLIKKINKLKFDRTAADVVNTPQCRLTSNTEYDIVIVSQVYSAAVFMTLLALKSFILKMDHKVRLDLIDDGSLDEADKQIFKQHFSAVNIIPITSIELHGCPKGGCWERLCYILDIAKRDYVIQVDTDTITVRDIPEIVECFKTNTAFVISGPKWQAPIDSHEMANIAKKWNNPHVQSSAESLFDELSSINITKYCRGCAAFASFPKGTDLLRELADFSSEMEQKLGVNKWNEWGSEQLTSNVMISLTEKPLILPWPAYQNYGFPFEGTIEDNGSRLIHFVGSHRYDNGVYRCLALKVISDIKNANQDQYI